MSRAKVRKWLLDIVYWVYGHALAAIGYGEVCVPGLERIPQFTDPRRVLVFLDGKRIQGAIRYAGPRKPNTVGRGHVYYHVTGWGGKRLINDTRTDMIRKSRFGKVFWVSLDDYPDFWVPVAGKAGGK